MNDGGGRQRIIKIPYAYYIQNNLLHNDKFEKVNKNVKF